MLSSILKILKELSITLVLIAVLSMMFSPAAYADAPGAWEPPPQSPAQVLVQIVVTAVILKVLERFNLP